VDGGDTGEGPAYLQGWKTVLLWEAMETMGYDLIAFGEKDFSDTSMVWLQSHNGKKTQFVTGNLIIPGSSMHVKQPWAIVKRGDVKIGFVTALDPRLKTRIKGYDILPVQEILNQAQSAFTRENVDFRVMIYHGLIHEANKLAEERSDFDLILLSHSIGRPMQSRIHPGKVAMVGPGDRGRELAWITLKKPFNPELNDKVQAHIIPLDNSVASSPKADPILKRAQEVGKSIYEGFRQKRARLQKK